MKPLSFAEHILYSTTRLTAYRGGEITGTGTGFFYNMPLEPDLVAFLMITNKHVVEGATEIAINFHIAHEDQNDPRPSGKTATWKFDVRPNIGAVVNHPRDDIDLCAINLSAGLTEASAKGYRFFSLPMSRKALPGPEDWQSFDVLEEVVMIGCPRGIYDETNNIPIMRRGITATPMIKDFNGKPEFLVDMACFGGSSGSPVYVLNREGFYDKTKNKFVADRVRFHLVGILWGGPLARADVYAAGEAPAPVAVTTTMHLGYVIRSTQLLGIEVEIQRRRAAQKARQAESDAARSNKPPEIPRRMR